MPSQVSNKLGERRHAVATDRNGSEIRKDDTVKEIGGEGKQGQIICIYRSFLFLHNREVPENGGNFVVRANNVATIAAKGGRAIGNGTMGTDLTKMNPNMLRNGGNMAAPPVPKTVGRDRLIGKTVIIRRGPLKGLLGIVKDSTDTHARVELHTKRSVVTVAKENLGIKELVHPHHHHHPPSSFSLLTDHLHQPSNRPVHRSHDLHQRTRTRRPRPRRLWRRNAAAQRLGGQPHPNGRRERR
jgi:transcription elongation factor SPT5